MGKKSGRNRGTGNGTQNAGNTNGTATNNGTPSDKPKRNRKPRDPNAPRKSWAERQTKRIAKLTKLASRVGGFFRKHKPSGAEDAIVAFDAIDTALVTITTRLGSLGTFKVNVRGPKVTVGGKISVLPDKHDHEMFKLCQLAWYEGATVAGDDGHYWIVDCTDGQRRAIRKLLVQPFAEPSQTEAPAGNDAAPDSPGT